MFPEIRLESWNIRFESFVLQRRRKGRERLPFDAKNIFLMGFTTYNGVEQVSEVEKEDWASAGKDILRADQFSILGILVGLRLTPRLNMTKRIRWKNGRVDPLYRFPPWG